ncbi:MAG: hypothetical protein K2K45_00140 [Muribaculaceae bacterium]|nr:hypothetical protein [Muribaculaceae bacterium]MDE7096091.1 hypothetical protein [Muribaculaceae bacterium]
MTIDIAGIKDKFKKIASDTSREIEDRIEDAISFRNNLEESSDNNENLKVDEICYTILIEMLHNENATMSNISDLIALYTLLAETLAEEENYIPIKEIAYEVREMIRINMVPWDVIKENLPRLIDTVNETVFRHTDYDLHLLLLKKAFEADDLNEEFKGRARHLLKLRILLEDADRHDWMLDKPLQDRIAGLFTPEELMKIILKPQIGHLRQDPVEYTCRWEEIYYEVENRLKERFANVHRQMGFCFRYWNAKRELLKDEYGIEWKSPSQMNPRVKFD